MRLDIRARRYLILDSAPLNQMLKVCQQDVNITSVGLFTQQVGELGPLMQVQHQFHIHVYIIAQNSKVSINCPE